MLQSQLLSNTSNMSTNSAAGGKIDCAKECPCGVPVIVSILIEIELISIFFDSIEELC